ncbi:TIGR02680 family protein [Streptomyces sp. NPDC050610]|uniref:TIGR02680 family protein n=1 Tax=Streptomyces sp. NPDC050610 TaxID=3157097 RepID=UPI00343DFCD8
MTVTALPQPRAERASALRWQPSRAGVLNVWRYYDEVFTFHRGKLLLRGPNGTGKSKALEVLLPFLYDASLRPNRLSTFGGSERTMHWNLMGEGASGVTRVGYVWLEFRTDAGQRDGTGKRDGAGDGAEGGDGGEEVGGSAWFTIGARLQASERTTSVTADYFTTTQRVGVPGVPGGLSLVGESGQPLTRAALAQALTGHGELHASGADHRAAVRRTLFPGLTEQRYDALITALLQLRTPKLSERLDPSLLSTLLSRALPPLDRGELSDLADGFERLDRQREHLAKLDGEVRAAQTLAARQRSYAQRVLRAGAADLIAATTDMDNRTRAARESEEEYDRALVRRTDAQEKQAEVEELGEELRSRIEGLTESETYRKGRELDRLGQRAADARREADTRGAAAEGARGEAHGDAVRAAEADAAATAEAGRARDAAAATEGAARQAGLTTAYAEAATAVAAGDADLARQLLHGAVRGRLGAIATVRTAFDAHRDAVRERDAAEAALEDARAALAAASQRRTACDEDHRAALGEQARRLRAWAAGCTELAFGADLIEELAAQAAHEAEVLTLTEAAVRTADRALASAETTAARRRAEEAAVRERLAAEAAELEGESDLPPEPPRTRTADRSVLPGAPLWKLVAFHESVPDATQAGTEAALEAAGLLDAWVGPHGGLLAAGHDTFAEADWAEPVAGSGFADAVGSVPAPARSLADVLRPEPDAPVPAERILRLLSGIAYGETLPEGHRAAVGADGTWRLASMTGSWAKTESAHIGAMARHRARTRRIAELTHRIGELDVTIAECDNELSTVAGRRRALDLERRGRPDHRPVAAAQRALDHAESDVAHHDDTVRTAVTRRSVQEKGVTAARLTLEATAAEHALPTDREALERLVESAENLRETAGQWIFAELRLAHGLRTAAEVRGQADRSLRTAEERESEAHRAETAARTLAATLEEVTRSVGAEYKEVLARIEQLRADLRRAHEEVKRLSAELIDLAGRIGALGNSRLSAADQRDTAIAARDAAAGRLRRYAALGFPADAGAADFQLAPGDGTKATLEAARTVAAQWHAVPHAPKNLADALGRLGETVHESRQALSDRADLDLGPDDEGDVQVFTAAMDGASIGAAQLLTALTAERDRSRDDITAAERELFDQTLTGDTRRHLAARIRQANELVDAMNARLERVRTASRVAVRLVWQVDPALPPGTRAARELLLKDPVRVTEADRDALHRFFRDRIEEAKAADTAASWEEQLAQVLDYTAWHQFVVKLDRANGHGWQLLTKKLHGALSGGEKAIALHLPLFAAVAAHYHAVPRAPRLILLDEVFVGVDATNRGQVFDLLRALDLDLMLTSDHEWCTYRELDGIAVHQLITGDGGGDAGDAGADEAVTTARFVWDGAELVPDGEGL